MSGGMSDQQREERRAVFRAEAERRDALLTGVEVASRAVSIAQAAECAAVAAFLDVSDSLEQGESEIAAALHLSRPTVGRLITLALGLGRLPGTAAAFAAGDITRAKAQVLVEATMDLDPDLAAALEAAALRKAAGQTPSQLRDALRRARLKVDPDAAKTRRDRALAGRSVSYRDLADGIGLLQATFDAADGVAVWQAVDALARRMRADVGETRPLPELRSAALHALVLGQAEVRTEVQLIVRATAEAVRGQGAGAEEPGSLAGHGWISAAHIRQLAHDAVLRRCLTHPATGALIAVDDTTHRPNRADRRAADRNATREPLGARIEAILRAPFTAQRTAMWQPTYRPLAGLERFIKARDVTCRWPGCRLPAARTDVDHTIPWPTGPTAAWNLACLCRYHDRMKHTAGWRLHQLPNGRLIFTSPTGRVYITDPPTNHTRGSPPTT